MTLATKWCPRCEEYRSISAFGTDFRTRAGLSRWCVRCEESAIVCLCEVAAMAPNHECILCHCPVIAGMAPHLREVMDRKWPEWRDQPVITVYETAATG